MVAGPPPGPEPSLRVVPLHDRGGRSPRLEREPLDLVFSPMVDLRVPAVVGYEVLLRLASEPAAEAQTPAGWSRQGHPAQADRVEAALLRLALTGRARLPKAKFLLVSVSSRALGGAELLGTLAGERDLGGVVIAVSDDADPTSEAAVPEPLARLRRAGAAFGVDVTAGGYASLQQIVALRPDLIRVGAAFTAEVDREPAQAAVVEALGAVAARIGARLIAADVPGRPDLHALMRLGVTLTQGPVFGAVGPEPAPLSEPAREAIAAGRVPARFARTVAEAVEPLEPLEVGLTTGEIADRFLADPRHDALVVVDTSERPVALIDRAALLRGESFASEPMTVPPDGLLTEVARRAMSRPRCDRLRSLVCRDAGGRYLGIVRIERLVDALASEPERGERRVTPGAT